MKTARITLLVEYEDEAPTGAFFNSPALDGDRAARMDVVPIPMRAGLRTMYGAQITRTPKVELDQRSRCVLTEGQFHSAICAMRQRGGGFARSLAETLCQADSINREKLEESFHDFIWAYMAEGAGE